METDTKGLREVHRKERMSPYLTNVGHDFYGMVMKYISEVDGRIEQARDNKSRLAILIGERETLKNTITDIFEIRERKIVTNALYYAKSGEEIEIENLTPEEEKMLREICELINGYRNGLLEEVLSGEGEGVVPAAERKEEGEKKVQVLEEEPPKKEPKKEEMEYLTIKVMKDMPPISGIDGQTYGPFKEEDVVTMPKKNASILLGKGAAEVIDI